MLTTTFSQKVPILSMLYGTALSHCLRIKQTWIRIGKSMKKTVLITTYHHVMRLSKQQQNYKGPSTICCHPKLQRAIRRLTLKYKRNQNKLTSAIRHLKAEREEGVMDISKFHTFHLIWIFFSFQIFSRKLSNLYIWIYLCTNIKVEESWHSKKNNLCLARASYGQVEKMAWVRN